MCLTFSSTSVDYKLTSHILLQGSVLHSYQYNYHRRHRQKSSRMGSVSHRLVHRQVASTTTKLASCLCRASAGDGRLTSGTRSCTHPASPTPRGRAGQGRKPEKDTVPRPRDYNATTGSVTADVTRPWSPACCCTIARVY